MSYTESELATLAASHLGNGEGIEDIDTETSKTAIVIRDFKDIARRTMIMNFRPPFSKKVADLALVEADPTDEWGYSYTYPPDCLDLHRILSGTRQDTSDTAVPYEIAYGTDSTVIYTDVATAQAEYTADIDNMSRWPDDFALAYTYLLAYLIAPRLLGGDPGKLGQTAFQLYTFHASRAKARAKNERRSDPRPDAAMVRARDS